VANNNLRLEKVDDAIKDYEKVLNAAPRSTVAADGLTRAFYLKAQKESTGAFFASNDYQNAEQSIDRAVSMNPNNLELRLAQAKLYALAGKQVELSTIGQPRNDGERIAYAEALLAQNKFKESSEQMSYLIGQTNTAKPLFALADLSLIIKDLDSANAAYKKASSLPDGAERAKWGLDQVAKARDLARQDMTMAEDLARRKQLASAVDKYHSSIFANPRSAEAREGLATALEKLYPNDPKEMREATTQLKAFLALTPALPAKEQEKVEKHIAKLETHASKMERQIATVPHRTSAFSRFGIHR
jgi:Flp pilus assembly protein TadD